MKVGTENRQKTIAAAVLAVLAIWMLVRAFRNDEPTAPASAPAPTAARRTTAAPNAPARRTGAQTAKNAPHPLLAQTLDPTLRFDLLKSSEDVTYKGSGRDIFRSQAPPPDIPKVVQNPVSQTPPPPPPAPPIPLKFYGFASQKNGVDKRIFLASGEDVFVAREGQIVNRRYKILKVNPTSIDVEDVLTNNRQTLPLSSS